MEKADAIKIVMKKFKTDRVDFCKDFGDFFVCSISKSRMDMNNTLLAVDKKSEKVTSYYPMADFDRWCKIMGTTDEE